MKRAAKDGGNRESPFAFLGKGPGSSVFRSQLRLYCNTCLSSKIEERVPLPSSPELVALVVGQRERLKPWENTLEPASLVFRLSSIRGRKLPQMDQQLDFK